MTAALATADVTIRIAVAGDHDALVALQHAAYAPNRTLLGVEPIPLLADYRVVLAEREVWLAEENGRLVGALILEPRADDLLIESIATAPGGQGRGLGRRLLALAEARARALGHCTLRLYTGAPLVHNIAWYARHGFATERIETLPARQIVHMMKQLPPG